MLALLAALTLSATPATLTDLLAGARCGDSVVLRPGDYGEVVISNRSCAVPLKLDTRAATLALRVQVVDGLTIRGGVFDAGASLIGRGVSIDGSSRVQLIGATVDGAVNGVVISRSSNITVRDAVTRHIVGNGVTIAGSQGVTVRGLVCRDATPDPTGTIHPDCLQAWSMPERKTTDVLITGVDMTGPTQGIFLAGDDGFERIRIFANKVAGMDAPNGIAIRSDCLDCVVTSNRVSTLDGSKWQTRIYMTDPNVKLLYNLVLPYLHRLEPDDAPMRMALADGPTAGIAAVPEPSTWAMIIGGIGAVAGALRCRRRPARAARGQLR